MLGGCSQKDPGAAVLKKVSLPGSDKHTFIPVNPSSRQVIMMPHGQQTTKPAAKSPQLVMVRAPTPGTGGQSILVPMNAVSAGKYGQAGGGVTAGHPIILNPGKSPRTMVIPGSKKQPSQQILTMPSGTSASPDKPMIIVQSTLGSGGTQRVLLPATKGSKGAPFIMVPVSSPSSGHQNVKLAPSNLQQNFFINQKGGSTSHPHIITQPGVTSGMNLVPVTVTGSSMQKGAHLVRMPQTTLTTSVNGKPVPLRLSSGSPASAKTVFIPDSALGSLPKGTRLVPLQGMSQQAQKTAMQIGSNSLGALQGGKVVFIPNNPITSRCSDPHSMPGNSTSLVAKNKNIIIVGGPGGRSLQTTKTDPKTTIIKTITTSINSRPSVVYRNVSTSSANKPIKPKPVVETSDTFFKTPIEIKPLEEEEDGDLNDVLNALSGRGHVDLVPVNAPTPRAVPVPVSPQDFGLKIDSVYSLSSATGEVSWDEDTTECKQPHKEHPKESVNDNSSKQKSGVPKGTEMHELLGKTSSTESSSASEKSQAAVSVSSSEPLLPEDEPSQSGPPTPGQSEKTPTKKADTKGEDPTDDVGKKDEDSNLMRGDCLQVRLAQQAARQLQEQMRLDKENLSMVQAEWDNEEMAGSENDDGKDNNDADDIYGGDTTDASLPNDSIEKESDVEMEVGRECTGDPQPSGSGSSQGTVAKDGNGNSSNKNEKSNFEAATKPKSGDKTDNDNADDVAQKALIAATLNGCEVADEDLNDMFDELISEYLTIPERPKPSVRVRGIDECKTFMEDSPQSLVTTTQQSSLQNLNTSIIPRTIPALENKMKPRTVVTAAGTITLIPVKVPVAGKPGETTIKYIPMQIPQGAETKGKTQMPEFVKILQNAAGSKASGVQPAVTKTSPGGSKTLPPKAPGSLTLGGAAAAGQTISIKGSDGVVQTIQLKGTGIGPQTFQIKGPDGKLQTIQLKSPTNIAPKVQVRAPVSAPQIIQGAGGRTQLLQVKGPGGGIQTLQIQGSPEAGQIVQLKGAPGSAPRFVRIIPVSSKSGTPSVNSPLGKSLLKMVMAPSVPPVSTSTTSTESGSLSNEDMAMAIMSATKNVFGKGPIPHSMLPSVPKPNIVYVKRPQMNIRGPVVGPKSAHLAAARRLTLHNENGPIDVIVTPKTQDAATEAIAEALKKKKKKKKKKIKLVNLPETKKCHVLLRKLNMKIIKNGACNLKRVKKGFLFEAISRQPRREAKRKATEVEKNADVPAAKKSKNNKGEPISQPVSHPTSTSRTAPLMQSNVYRIMSQLPMLKPAVSGAPRPTPNQIMGLPQEKRLSGLPQEKLYTNPMNMKLDKNSPEDVNWSMGKSVQDKPIANQSEPSTTQATTVTSSMPSTITLTLSCTTATSLTTAKLPSHSVYTTSNTSGTVLTAACSAPVLSPIPGKLTMMSAPSRSLLPAAQSLVVSSPSDALPRMPTLQPAGQRVNPTGQTSMNIPMPTLQPAPRSLLGLGQNAIPQSTTVAAAAQKPALPPIRPRPVASPPPIVIQPTGPTTPPIFQPAKQPTASAGASSQSGGGLAPNKKYLLIKTSSGQFLVPVPVSKPGGAASGAAGPTSFTPIVSNSPHGGPIQLDLPLTQPAVSGCISTPISSTFATNSFSGNSSVRLIAPARESQNIGLLPGVRIKEEPKDTGYNKHEIPIAADAVVKQEKVVPEVEPMVAEEPEEEPRVPAPVCHKQRIEELKARLREHEEQLLQLKKKREDTKKILESLDEVEEQSD